MLNSREVCYLDLFTCYILLRQEDSVVHVNGKVC